MNYKITITNPGSHIFNPLIKLRGNEYATREDACEAIYAAMYDVIDSAAGCEMVDKPDDLNTRGSNYYVAKIKCYAAGDEARMGGAFVWCGDNDRNWERQSDTTDGGLSMTYDEAVALVDDLESCLHIMEHGEFGRPDYYIIDDRTHDWLCASYDSGKYDFPDEEMSDDDLAAWTNRRDEDYVRDHAISNDDDRQLADDDANNKWHSWYIGKCREYIYREGGATEDGVSAAVEEVGGEKTNNLINLINAHPELHAELINGLVEVWVRTEEPITEPVEDFIRRIAGDEIFQHATVISRDNEQNRMSFEI